VIYLCFVDDDLTECDLNYNKNHIKGHQITHIGWRSILIHRENHSVQHFWHSA